MATRTTKNKRTTKTTTNSLAKKATALKKNALKTSSKATKAIKTNRKKITGLVNNLINKSEDTLNEIVVEAKRRLS